MKRISTAMLLAAAVAMAPGCKKDKGGDAEPEQAEPIETETPTESETPPEEPEEASAELTDVGLPNQLNPVEHVVTGGQITDEHIAKAKEAGVTHIVNVRDVAEQEEYAEEKEKVEAAGMTYVHMPIVTKTGEGLTEENAKKLDELLKKEEPMIVHCKSGQRVGMLWAMKAKVVDGKTVDEAIEIGKQAGLTNPDLEKLTREKLK